MFPELEPRPYLAHKVKEGEIHDPVLSFELDNGFKFIKILSNYLDDVRSVNYASFIEWLNPDQRKVVFNTVAGQTG